jgi:pyruvate/2-oxoglutarate dehydrogenase complex dihydrolipoamide dehydrogenase (E3) component
MARIAIKNSLFYGGDKFSSLIIPWCTFTEPEVAHVGLYPADMEEKGIAYDTLRKDFDDNDRNRTEGETVGFVKIHVQRGTDVILGATIVGEAAGDMISEITVAMSNGMGLSTLVSSCIMPLRYNIRIVNGILIFCCTLTGLRDSSLPNTC